MIKPIVNSHNDWDKLEELIVGSLLFYNIPEVDESIKHSFRPSDSDLVSPFVGKAPQHLVDEAEEDLLELIKTLQEFDVTVKRPTPFHHDKEISTPFWKTTSMHSCMPRDCLTIVGNEIIEVPMPCRSRFFEVLAFKDILLDYFEQGAKWSSAPRPRLLDETYDDIYLNQPVLKETEPLFDAANIIRCGRDLFFNLSNTGNKLGLKWLQSHLSENYRVHPISVCWDNVDTTIVLLKPGKVLVNPERISIENLPEHFKNWDIIWAPEPEEIGYGLDWPRASKWISMSLLSIDQEHVIVEKSQISLMKLLEKNGFTVVPVQFRHCRTFGGGFHCMTMDIRRQSSLEDYFS